MLRAHDIYLEAEHGHVGAQWNVLTDPATGDGRYVAYAGPNQSTPGTDPARLLRYDVPVHTAAAYRLYFHIDAPDGTQDSYWVRIDGGDWMLYHAEVTTGWEWDRMDSSQVQLTFPLDAGYHRLEIQPREKSRLDKILFTDATTAPVGLGPAAVNRDEQVTVAAEQPLYLKQYRGIPGTFLIHFAPHPGYPNNPDTVRVMSGFSQWHTGETDYGGRTDGYLLPTETGYYRFNITADDASELQLSPNDLPAHLLRVAGADGWSAVGEHDKFPSQTSGTHYLQAGRAYAIHARYKQGTGGDHLHVYWQTPSNPTTWQLIDAGHLAPLAPRELCGNGTDDDGDGNADLTDTDCAAPPTITAPADRTLDCTADLDDTNLTGYPTGLQTSCTLPAPAPSYTDLLTNYNPITQQRTITRTWQLTDACGRTATADQLLTLRACIELPGDGVDNDNNGPADCLDPAWDDLGAGILADATAACVDSAFVLRAADPAYRHHVVPIGWYYTGAMDRLYFVLDDDNAPKDGTAHFARIKLYETGCNGCAPYKLDDYTVSSYGGTQDAGSYQFTEGGYGIRLTNNAWKSLNIAYIITPNTVLEFDYYSTAEAEVHGIGLDDNMSAQGIRTFQLHGTQAYGIADFSYTMPTYNWGFGANATPPGASGPGPHSVRFGTAGPHTATLSLGQGGCVQSATATLTAHAPTVANDDSVNSDCPGVMIAGNVLDNDQLAPGGQTLSVARQPAVGNVVLYPDGSFTYTPDGIACVNDDFTYRVCDDQTGCCREATVVLIIDDSVGPTLLNLPPALDTMRIDERLPVANNVSLTDNCPGIGLAYNETDNRGGSGCSKNNYRLDRTWTAADACGNQTAYTQQLHVLDDAAPVLYRIHTLPGSRKLIGGVLENVSQRWKKVRFPLLFDQVPLVFPQLASENELGAARVRIRNVTASSFEVRLIEEAAADQRRAGETVSYIAVEPGGTTGDWYARRDTLTTHTGQTVPLQGGFGGATQVFGHAQTVAWEEAASLRRWGQSPAQLNLRFDALPASQARNLPYQPETISLLQLPVGPLYNAAGERIGEVGQLSANHTPQLRNLTGRYHQPVVVTAMLTLNGGAPAATRLTSMGPDAFSVFVDELDYDDGAHATEQIGYLVLEGNLPADTTVSCDAVPAPPVTGTELRAVDNGDLSSSVLFTETEDRADCNAWTVRRDYFVSDACGNTTTASYTLTLVDTVAPAFSVPADLTIPCNFDYTDPAVTGAPTDLSDACDAAPQLSSSLDSTGLAGCNGLLLRTWIATDRCGNATMATQRINVYDNTDNDNDGVPDGLDLDTDNDGMADLLEGDGDPDGDGLPNYLDLDSDNDGLSDLIEGGHHDSDGDGVVDNFLFLGWDADGDGLALGFDGNDNDTTVAASLTMDMFDLHHDRDQDGVPNYLDLDSDNDGLTDLLEAGGVDTDGDGRIDRPDPLNPFSITDADFDGYADLYDPDHDNLPGVEKPTCPLLTYGGAVYVAGTLGLPVDFDMDGVPNVYDLDSDNDGIPDLIEAGGVDTDGDGRVDLGTEFVDLNQNGLHDNYEQYPLLRSDPDGSLPDGRPQDTDANGTPYTLADADLDALPNSLDTDADNDGRRDLVELANAPADTDHDGRLDAFIDSNFDGLDDATASSGRITTETDGANDDGRPSDSGDADQSPYVSTLAPGTLGDLNGDVEVDKDGDGLPNFLDTDSDGDGLSDALEDADLDGQRGPTETDSFDADTDDDQLTDGIEDADGNGAYSFDETDPRRWDTDGDTLGDGQEDSNLNGYVDGAESDPRDPCDPIPSGACIGIRLAPKVWLQGPLLQVQGGALMRDDLRARGLLPLQEPYAAHPSFVHTGGGGGELVTDTLLFFMEGNNAIVDWVFVEIRDASDPAQVVATQSALLQRDGEVVSTDGSSVLEFPLLPSADYYVAIRHRNHLGVMIAAPLAFTPTPRVVDFTDANQPLYHRPDATAQDALRLHNGRRVLWCGNLNGDHFVAYDGPGNERSLLALDVLFNLGNVNFLPNYVVSGYYNTDTNMDGVVILQGGNNDRYPILFFTVLSAAGNTNSTQNYTVFEQLPPDD